MINKPTTRKQAFTLIELLAGIAIIAALVAFGVVYVAGYISDSKRIADQRTLTVLNDALTRYKCEGGDVNAFTAGAPMSRVIARLQQPITWAGMTHSVLQAGKTYLGRSIYALGDKQQYRFTQFNTFTGEQGGRSPVDLNASAGGLVGWWKFDETNGTVAADSSGGGNNASLTAETSWTTGKKGNGLSSIAGYYAIVNNNSVFNIPNALTVSLWFYPRQIPAGYAQHIIQKWSTTNNANYVLYFFGNGSPMPGMIKWYANKDGSWGGIGSGYNPPLNQWTHIVLAYDSTKDSQIYINGAAFGPVTTNAGVLATNTINLLIGNADCIVDDVRIYNRALSAAEVQDLYSQ